MGFVVLVEYSNDQFQAVTEARESGLFAMQLPARLHSKPFRARIGAIFFWRTEMLNLTQHEITLITSKGEFVFPPSGTIARVETLETVIGYCPVTGAPIVKREKGKPVGLPAEGTPCLVSSMVLEEVPGRVGVFAPDSGRDSAIRDEKGLVVAVTRLIVA